MATDNKSSVVALAVTELVAGSLKTLLHGPKESDHEAFCRHFFAALLLLLELGCNIAVGVITVNRFGVCSRFAKASFAVLLTADIIMWMIEAFITFMVLRKHNRHGTGGYFCRYMFNSVVFLCPLLVPFIVGAVRSLVIGFPECSDSHKAEAIVMLLVGILFVLFLLNYVRRTKYPGFGGLAVVGFLSFSLGLWTAIEPRRQIIINGLLIILPPTATLFISVVKVFLVTEKKRETTRNQTSSSAGAAGAQDQEPQRIAPSMATP